MAYSDEVQSSDDRRELQGRQRVLTSLRNIVDNFRYPYDDSVAALEALLEPADDDEATIAELMRHKVDRRLGGSRGRRRREPAKARERRGGSALTKDATVTSRVGRPAKGAEVRVYVQTSIAQRTHEILVERAVTLADVFDDVARQLDHEH